MCVCVCACERERERVRVCERESKCVCVCVREREVPDAVRIRGQVPHSRQPIIGCVHTCVSGAPPRHLQRALAVERAWNIQDSQDSQGEYCKLKTVKASEHGTFKTVKARAIFSHSRQSRPGRGTLEAMGRPNLAARATRRSSSDISSGFLSSPAAACSRREDLL